MLGKSGKTFSAVASAFRRWDIDLNRVTNHHGEQLELDKQVVNFYVRFTRFACGKLLADFL
jgi:hypothetical protein